MLQGLETGVHPRDTPVTPTASKVILKLLACPQPSRKDTAPLPQTDVGFPPNYQSEREKEMLTRPFWGDNQQANKPISPLLKQTLFFSTLVFHILLLGYFSRKTQAQLGIPGCPTSISQNRPLKLKILQSEKF